MHYLSEARKSSNVVNASKQQWVHYLCTDLKNQILLLLTAVYYGALRPIVKEYGSGINAQHGAQRPVLAGIGKTSVTIP